MANWEGKPVKSRSRKIFNLPPATIAGSHRLGNDTNSADNTSVITQPDFHGVLNSIASGVQTLPGFGRRPDVKGNDESTREKDMQALEDNMKRLNDAEKMPDSPRKSQYLAVLNKRIDALMKKVEGGADDDSNNIN